ncbi:MAG: glycosyltransferase [Candidatus Peregrinibacteria bacterium]|nr:glycosyltransferase [Candidatus Peregrinibacteria bacterium]
MYAFWDNVLAPLLMILQPSVVVEIGCETGKCTRKLLEYLAPRNGVLHAIDPAPILNIAQWRQEWGSAFVLHPQRSLDVLANSTNAQMVCIDGDHNWYTVFHELKILERTCSTCFPLVVLHDTSWPYARRDMYYNPAQIPPEYVQPFTYEGIPIDSGHTINKHLANAAQEGGARNGVLTAIEDFLQQTTLPIHHTILPGFHGLSILVDERLFALYPALRRFLQERTYTPVQADYIARIDRERIQASSLASLVAPLEQSQKHLLEQTRRYTLVVRKEVHALIAQMRQAYANRHLALVTALHQDRLVDKLTDQLVTLQQELFTLKRTRSVRWFQRRNHDPVPPENQPVDILIPIHNAYEGVVQCIESVLNNTQSPHRIILLDDASTDTKLLRYLHNIARQYDDRVLLIRSQRNGGFVRTANKGMALSDHDVVLLNSDTIVPPGWLYRLRKTARECLDVGSIIPLSNASSIYSVLTDVPWLNHPHPEHVAQIDALVQHSTESLRPEIPTAVGFCMYIPRRALKRVGLFDLRFGMGYGEENDWCMRAASQGFVQYLDDTVFVYHKGGASMGAAGILQNGQITVEANEKLLRKKQPEFHAIIRQYRKNNHTLTRIQQTVANAYLHRKRRRHIAFVIHQHPNSNHFGGSTYHVMDLVRSLRTSIDCTILYPVSATSIGVLQIVNDHEHQTTVSQSYADLLRCLNPDVLHVHQPAHSGFSVFSAAASLGIPSVYTLHDYLSIDPHFRMIGPGGLFVGLPNRDDPCPTKPGWTYGKWQYAVRGHLLHADAIIAPSQYAMKMFDRVFEDLPAKRYVIEHGYPPVVLSHKEHAHQCDVCFFGASMGAHKGKSLIVSVTKELCSKGLTVGFLGANAKECPALCGIKNVQWFGRYNRERAVKLLQEIHPKAVALFPMWPETYSYTLTEAWSAGIPVIASDMGAIGERMRAVRGGMLLTSMKPLEICGQIMRWLDSPSYDDAKKQIATYTPRSAAVMASQYMQLYEQELLAGAFVNLKG